METLVIKNTELKVSRFCMGGCPMGGYGWGTVEDDKLVEAIKTALDMKVNFFDTADTYGLGKAEQLLGEALGANKNDVVIASKFGVRIENGRTFYDNSPEWIEKALTSSLKRLKRDYIDLYQIHYRDGKTSIDEIVSTLDKFKEKGYVRYYGLSNIYENDIGEITSYKNKFASFQDEYSLACRENEKDIKKISKKLDITPLTWGSLGQGILTGKYDSSVTFDKNDRRSREIYSNFHGRKLKKNMEIVATMKEIAKEVNHSVASVAIRYILDYLEGSVVLAGVKKPSQLCSNVEAMGWKLSEAQINRLLEVSKDKDMQIKGTLD